MRVRRLDRTALKELARLPEWKTVQRYPSGFRFPGGESFAEMQTRITATLARLAAVHRGETIVAVSTPIPSRRLWPTRLGTHLDLFQRIVVSPCRSASSGTEPARRC